MGSALHHEEDKFRGKDGKREALLLMEVGGLFTRANLTGEKGVLVLEATEALLRDSKKGDPHGGMFGALASLYANPDLPVGIMERVLVHLMQYSFWRENSANAISRALEFFKEQQPDLSKPWRECVGLVFAKKAQEKATGYKSLKEIKSHFTDSDFSEQEDDI